MNKEQIDVGRMKWSTLITIVLFTLVLTLALRLVLESRDSEEAVSTLEISE